MKKIFSNDDCGCGKQQKTKIRKKPLPKKKIMKNPK
jgi:hypothetical protein